MLQRDGAIEAELGGLAGEGCNCHRIVEYVVQPAYLQGARQDDELGPNQAEVMTLPRSEHHTMSPSFTGFT